MSTFYANYPVEGGGGGVTSLNSLTGALTLVAGSNITITPLGSNITISSTSGGSVTSVGLADSTNLFNITGSPVTTTGTLTLSSFKSQAQDTFLAAPTGSSGAPTFRTMVVGDLSFAGQPNGVATLDGSGKVPASELPSTVLEYQGLWNPSTNTPTLQDSTGTNGFVYQVSTAFAGPITGLNSPTMVNFQVGNLVIFSSAAGEWQQADSLTGVTSVNGAVGAVTVNAINQLTGDVTASAASQSQSKATSLVATSNSTLTTLSGLTTASSLASVGTITTGTWNGTTIAIAHGGTNATTSTQGSIPNASSTTAATWTATPTLGISGTTTGILNLNSSTAASASISVLNGGALSAYNFNLPTTVGTAGQVLTSQGGGSNAMTWSTGNTGSVTSVGMSVPTFLSVSGSPITTSGTLAVSLSGTALPTANGGTGQTAALTLQGVIYANSTTSMASTAQGVTGSVLVGNGGGAPFFSSTPTLGISGSTLGTLTLATNTSGSWTISPASVTAGYTLILPTDLGTSGQVLTTSGSSSTAATWVTPSTTANSGYRSVTGTDTATTADNVLILSGTSFTETLFTAVGNTGHIIQLIHNGTSVTNKYTLNTTSSQTIGGIASGTYVLWTNSEVLTIISDGSNWQILNHKTTTGFSTGLAFTYNNLGTVSNNNIYSRRVGDSLQVYGSVTAGTTVATAFEMNLPTGLTIDSTKFPATASVKVGDLAEIPSTGSYPTTGNGPVLVFYDGSTTSGVFIANASSSVTTFAKLNGSYISTNSMATMNFTVPISGWQP